MRNIRWQKIIRDLLSNETRTALVVLSIAVGVFAIGTIASARIMLTRDLAESYARVSPASARLAVEEFDQDLVEVIRDMEEVAEAEGRRSVSVRVKVGEGEAAMWRDLSLVTIADYDDIRVDKPRPEQGAWPPPEHELLLERSSRDLLQVELGDTILVELPSGKQRQMTVAGLVNDQTQLPTFLSNTGYGYITLDTLEWLDQDRTFTNLNVIVADTPLDQEHIRSVANQIRDKIEKSDRTVHWIEVPVPGQHPLNQFISTITMLIGALGSLSLLLSGFLVVNTISALLTQQTKQIGVMKAVGARAGQLIRLYLSMIFIFGLLALGVAVPLGAVASRLFARFVAGSINIDLSGSGILYQVLALEILVGLIVPLLAALYPVIAGTRITVREAISSYELGQGRFGTGFMDRLLTREQTGRGLRFFSRPVLLSLRNTFRRKGRLTLTLATLVLSSAIFISVFSVRDALFQSLDDLLEYWQYDVGIQFQEAHRIEKIEQEARRIPGVEIVESWGFGGTRRLRPDGSESGNIVMLAPPAESELIQPTLVAGRWLRPEDEQAVVISTEVLKTEPDLAVGDDVRFKIEGRDTNWQVVGIVQVALPAPYVYVTYPYFVQVARDFNQSQMVQIVTTYHDTAFQTQVGQMLEEHFKRIGMEVGSISIINEMRQMVSFQFQIIIIPLLLMALLIGLVGGLGLMGTMSINVLERTREIGVMRSIGASDWAVMKMVLVEGILIGLLSWLAGVVVAIPLSYLLSYAVGMAFLQTPLGYAFSIPGVVIWLAIVLVLALLASFLPARRASRLTVREVLAYE